jgi:hypothetical protein
LHFECTVGQPSMALEQCNDLFEHLVEGHP